MEGDGDEDEDEQQQNGMLPTNVVTQNKRIKWTERTHEYYRNWNK